MRKEPTSPYPPELASTTTAHRLLQEQAASSISAASSAHEQVEKLLSDKAAIHEELGTLKGQQSALTVQLEAAKEAAAEQEREKSLKTEEANRLHADLARAEAEKDGATQQLAAAREEAAAARTAAADASVAVAEARAKVGDREEGGRGGSQGRGGDLKKYIFLSSFSWEDEVESYALIGRKLLPSTCFSGGGGNRERHVCIARNRAFMREESPLSPLPPLFGFTNYSAALLT